MQTKQIFYVEDTETRIEIRIEIKPWTVRTKSGLDGGILMEATVFQTGGFGVRGQAVCIPTDKFDFRFGAELALKKALAVTGNFEMEGKRVVMYETRKAIWNEFNKVLPKE